MHLTTIKTKDGKVYEGYIDKCHLKKGNRIAYVDLLLTEGRPERIIIEDMESATTEHERISVHQRDVIKDNLKEWKEIIERWG